jgi:hypothetical protein
VRIGWAARPAVDLARPGTTITEALDWPGTLATGALIFLFLNERDNLYGLNYKTWRRLRDRVCARPIARRNRLGENT